MSSRGRNYRASHAFVVSHHRIHPEHSGEPDDAAESHDEWRVDVRDVDVQPRARQQPISHAEIPRHVAVRKMKSKVLQPKTDAGDSGSSGETYLPKRTSGM